MQIFEEKFRARAKLMRIGPKDDPLEQKIDKIPKQAIAGSSF